jgi:hypothetical protein
LHFLDGDCIRYGIISAGPYRATGRGELHRRMLPVLHFDPMLLKRTGSAILKSGPSSVRLECLRSVIAKQSTLSTTGPLLPLIADVWTDPDFVATGQLRDSCAATSLFDHLVGARDERGWDREPESLRGLQVNHEIELGWLLDRKLRRSGALQDLVNENRGHAVHLAS